MYYTDITGYALSAAQTAWAHFRGFEWVARKVRAHARTYVQIARTCARRARSNSQKINQKIGCHAGKTRGRRLYNTVGCAQPRDPHTGWPAGVRCPARSELKMTGARPADSDARAIRCSRAFPSVQKRSPVPQPACASFPDS